MPKKASHIMLLHEIDERRTFSRSPIVRYCTKIESLTLEEPTNWEYFAATTMHHICKELAGMINHFDVTEQPPEGMPLHLWRLWITMRNDF